MIEKYEKEEVKETADGKEINFKEVLKAEANYIHYCGHDTNPPTPCRRVKI